MLTKNDCSEKKRRSRVSDEVYFDEKHPRMLVGPFCGGTSTFSILGGTCGGTYKLVQKPSLLMLWEGTGPKRLGLSFLPTEEKLLSNFFDQSQFN